MTLRLTTSQWWRVIGVIALVFLMFNASRPVFGRLEGMIWPVVGDAEITEIIEGDNFIDFSGTYNKIRDCDILRYDWYLLSRDGLHRDSFDAFILNPHWQSSRLGERRFGPRRAYITPPELLKYSYAIAVHDCHPFYKTKSLFFKGSEVK